MESDWNETLKLRIVEGHKLSGKRLPVTLLDDKCICTDDSWTGVEGLEGEGGVEGLFLSAEQGLLGNNLEAAEVVVLVKFGDPHRWGPDGDAGDDGLCLELISLV